VSTTADELKSMKTTGAFLRKGTCSETLLHVLDRAFEHPLPAEEHAATPLAGGILQHGYQCGMVWGSVLAAGAQAHRLFGTGPQAHAKALVAAGRIVESFRAQNEHLDCLEITGLDKSSSTMQMVTYFLFKGGTIGCMRMAKRYAPVARREILAALASAEPAAAPPARVSCAAMLAQRMGASDMHAVMAAGLAGGIGLSGGACGALGAAIWLVGLRSLEQGARKIAYKAPAARETIERFLKCTDYEFDCSTIVGRKFQDIADHAAFVGNGGCAKLLSVLAAG
jgi:hypothetical protein